MSAFNKLIYLQEEIEYLRSAILAAFDEYEAESLDPEPTRKPLMDREKVRDIQGERFSELRARKAQDAIRKGLKS